MGKLTTVTVIIFMFFASLVSPVVLQAKPYYEGKIITCIVGYPPGGGGDRMARFMAKHLPQYVPGKPVVLVQNMPGASSMIAANYIYNISKPDGLTILYFNRYAVLNQLLKSDGVRFDLTKFSWVGSPSVEQAVLTIRSDLPYQSMEDLKKAKETIFVGNTGDIDTGSQFTPLLKEFLGQNVKFVSYPTATDVILALERKEVSAFGFSYSTAKPYIDRGLVRPLMRGPLSAPGIENLPIDVDLAKSKQIKTIISILAAPDRIGRPFVAAPKTDENIMNILRDAFSKITQDPKVREEAKKYQMELEYTPAPIAIKIIKQILNQPSDIISEVGKLGKF